MKRPHDDYKEELHLNKLQRRYDESPLSATDSPIWRAPSVSPAYRKPAKHHRKFIGCSKITDYELLDKLGEGTFG